MFQGSKPELKQAIEAFAEEIVLLDPSDLGSVVNILTFNEMILLAAEEGDSTVIAAAKAAKHQLEQFIFADMDHQARLPSDVFLQRLNQLTSTMQLGTPLPEFASLELPATIIPDIEQVEAGNSVVKLAEEPLVEGNAPETVQPVSTPTVQANIVLDDLSLYQDFITEANEHLTAAEEQLLVLERDPNHADAVNTIFRAFHTIKGVAGLLAVDDIQQLSHEAENLLDRVRKRTISATAQVLDASLKALDGLKRMLNRLQDSIQQSKMPPPDPQLSALVQLLRDTSEEKITISESSSQSAIKRPATGQTSVAETPNIPSEQESTATKSSGGAKEPIKVDANRLDSLIDMIGEMVIAESMVQQDIAAFLAEDKRFSRDAAHLHKITRELQSLSLSMRMMPVRPVFQKMARLIRDLSKKANKKIEFVIEGEDTELDKSVVDKIGDPLVHMVRNAIDHGIESPEERVENGKPEIGTIRLRAYHRGGSIFIEMSDDGKGLNRPVILAKARERGIIASDAVLSDHEIDQLIFVPGFSTAKQVTGISGRGVGMDVVLRNIQALRGAVEVHSTDGKGTTITLRLPLTLAIIDGMLLQA
ncbi:MAG: chemotaxis protein CheA, partial [bacterium]|nr:chemotaxis protein CheA [bacterium]